MNSFQETEEHKKARIHRREQKNPKKTLRRVTDKNLFYANVTTRRITKMSLQKVSEIVEHVVKQTDNLTD